MKFGRKQERNETIPEPIEAWKAPKTMKTENMVHKGIHLIWHPRIDTTLPRLLTEHTAAFITNKPTKNRNLKQ